MNFFMSDKVCDGCRTLESLHEFQSITTQTIINVRWVWDGIQFEHHRRGWLIERNIGEENCWVLSPAVFPQIWKLI